MTVINNDNERFRSAAEELKESPKDSSWNRLETMLENDKLHQENKSYKNTMRWLSGIAASLLLVGTSSFFFFNSESTDRSSQVAYRTESIQLEAEKTNELYDIDKLSILNDAQLWSNIIEGGPKIQTKLN